MDWDQRIGRRIKLRDLHVLVAVAEHGSMAKAAEHLHISHPVVSKTIAALEHAVGVPLFDRTARGVVPTAYGSALVKSGIAVFDEMRAGVRRIEHLADPHQGELRFGCPEAIAGGLIQEVIARFAETHPRVTLDIVPADTVAGNLRELREREVEFLIGRIRVPFVDDELTAEVLGHEGLVIAAGKGNPLHRKKRDRMRAKLKEIKEELRKRMHQPVPEQGQWLTQVVRGYFAYHAVPTNARKMGAFRRQVIRLWLRTLRRRSQRRGLTWERIVLLADKWLPKPKILHPWPDIRFAARRSR